MHIKLGKGKNQQKFQIYVLFLKGKWLPVSSLTRSMHHKGLMGRQLGSTSDP